MANTFERNYVDVDGLGTFYVTAGQGPPVVLIHGGSPGACALVNWKLNIAKLAEAGFAVYAYDQPGFGHSEIPGDHSMEYRVSHARAFLDALGLDRFHLIGNSMGAYIVARIALEDTRARRLVFVSSTTLAPSGSESAQALAKTHAKGLEAYTPSLEAMRRLTMGTLYNAELVTDQLVEERYRMSAGARFEAMQNRRQAPRARSVVDALPQITNPALILWGADDRGAATERALLLFQALPNAELHVFSHCAHWVHWDQAARFNRMVTAFFLGADD